jgi:hypothetical protein
MRNLLDRLRGLAARGAALLGIGAVTFALLSGLTLGALPSAGLAFLVGKAAGYHAADRQAELNRLARDAAEARVDAANALAAADVARADAQRNAAAKAQAERRNDGYARELQRLGPMGACGLTDRDVARLRDDAWAVQRGARRAAPAPRR